jgi:hypothetical protein
LRLRASNPEPEVECDHGGHSPTDPHAAENEIVFFLENTQFPAVFLTHSPPRTTVPRLANPDQKLGCQVAKLVSTEFRVSRRWNEVHAPIVQLAPINYAEKREHRDVARSAGNKSSLRVPSSTTKRAQVY